MRILSRLARYTAGLLLLGAAPVFAQTPNYTTNITLARLLGSTGATPNTVGPIPYAQVCAYPADIYGNPISVTATNWGLILKGSPAGCGSVVNGAFTSPVPVPDSLHTNAGAPIYYNITIQPTNSTGTPTAQAILFQSVPGITGTSWALDSYAPSVNTPIAPSDVVVSQSSAPDTCTPPSLYLPSTLGGTPAYCVDGAYVNFPSNVASALSTYSNTQAYAAGSVVLYNNIGYIATTATSGNLPTNTAYWSQMWIAPGGNGTEGVIAADGTTYATIQAAYLAACAATPNENVVVPSQSTVPDTVLSMQTYQIASCTTQVHDERNGLTHGANGNVQFEPGFTRNDYQLREANLKLSMIKLIESGSGQLGFPAATHWVEWENGDSTGTFGYGLKRFELMLQYGAAGFFQVPSSGGGNNPEYYGVSQQGSLSFSTSTSGTFSLAPDGSYDPVSPGLRTMTLGTLGSNSATGSAQFFATLNTEVNTAVYSTFEQAKVIYAVEPPQSGVPAGTLTVSTSPDGVNFTTEQTVSAAATSTTGSILVVGYNGSGSAPGACTGNVTITATGYGGSGSGFAATGIYDPVAQQIGTINITSGGSGYANPVTFTSTGPCTAQPAFGPALLSSQSIGVVTVNHPGIGILQLANSGGPVRILGYGLMHPAQPGIVPVSLVEGGSNEYAFFQDPAGYANQFWQALPAPDTVFLEQFDTNQEGGAPWGQYVTKLATLANNMQAYAASQLATQSACNAAGYYWTTACQPYTPDTVYMAGYKVGTVDGLSAAGIPGQNLSALQAVNALNRAGGNAFYEDLYNSDISYTDSVNRFEFGASSDGTHKGLPGVARMVSRSMRDAFLEPGFFEQHVGTSYAATQGSRKNLSFTFLSTHSGLYYSPTLHATVAAGGLQSEGTLNVSAPTYDAPTATVVGAAGTTSSTYVVYAFGPNQVAPIGVTAPVTVTGPSPTTASDYIMVCLPYQIPGATSYNLVRTAGGASQGQLYATGLYTNASIPNCLVDKGQATSAYTGGTPTGVITVNTPTLDNGNNMANMATPDGQYDVALDEGYVGGVGVAGGGLSVRASSDTGRANACHFYFLQGTYGAQAYCNGTNAGLTWNFAEPMRAFLFTGTGLVPTLTSLTGTLTINTHSTATAGQFVSSTSGAVSGTLTFPIAVPNRYVCHFTDETTPADSVQSVQSTQPTATTLTFGGTTASGDIVSYSCASY